jgi:hypothetical protein
MFGYNQKDGTGVRESLDFDRLAFGQAWISESKHAVRWSHLQTLSI